MFLMSAKRFIFYMLPVVALLLTLVVGRPATAPSVTEVTELIKARINRMASVLIAREAEVEAYRERESVITSVSSDQSHRTPAEIEEALTAKCEKQLANLTINNISVGQPGTTELGEESRKTRFWPVEFQVLNPTAPEQNLHAVVFCYRDSEGGWSSKITKVEVVQNGMVHAVPKCAFREMGLE
jgi:hypothetical protein